MDSNNKVEGNPEIGMQGGIDDIQDTPANDDFGSDFFSQLDQDVNGMVMDESVPNAEVTQPNQSGPEQVTHNQTDVGPNNANNQSGDSSDWEKRYKDSSREAVRLKEQMNELKPFIPVLDAMKQDSGLVEHVRGYFQEGGKPSKSIQEQIGLDEDFVFDPNEMSDPDSDSSKLMNAHVDSLVQKRVAQMANAQKQQAAQQAHFMKQKRDEIEFKRRNNMTDEQFDAWKQEADKHILTLDDVHYLLNRNTVAQNTANATRQEMVAQMKNVQNMPATASASNSQQTNASPDDSVFDNLLGADGGIDDLFG